MPPLPWAVMVLAALFRSATLLRSAARLRLPAAPVLRVMMLAG